MAISKKFFVDIDLQGNALKNATIGTNSGIGSTEGAFGYDSTSHRLQYFDGTATKDVANLTDIAAVTGGLILQGGYNAATGTPVITDGSALKGFFWVVTEAGTFLGESVQVGDSIIAKVDAAGTSLTDWLILQGNVVIATDSVDGIVRLATQTEVNTGTEGGAVVVTPATLQGKIDAQITPEINSKVSKSGDTMSGNLDMGGNNITNVGELNGQNNLPIQVGGGFNLQNNSITDVANPNNNGDATNKQYVDDQDALKLSLTGGSMSGEIDMNDNAITSLPTPTSGGDATNKTYVDTAAATAESNANTYTNNQIAAQSLNIPLTGWQGDAVNGYYAVADLSAFGFNVIVQVMDGTTGDIVDTLIQLGGANTTIWSNIEIADNAWYLRATKIVPAP